MPRTKLPILISCALSIVALIGVSVWFVSREPASSRAISEAPAHSESSPDTPDTVSFNAHIRPILSNKCFACHGFDSTKREENLRLDTAEGAYAALESDPKQFAIIPGKPKESVVWQRIMTTDEDEIMPPPDYHKPLSENEKQLITRWIEQGAKYQEHWAFAAIQKPATPATSAKNPIDSFIRKNLEIHGLNPSPPADKATLLRRLSLDLIGLPPTPDELQAFLSDDSADAYEKQVDRLLASPHYGERMAVTWLDAVRYADTVGYHGDQNARIFPYRDYVIDSFNDNKPFDEFTREQLAGDLLTNPSDEQLIATGFLRLNLMTREGGAQDKEYLAKSAGDRVRAIGGAWLGLTTGCAECHDHKFDPFTQRDFYTMAAFFGDVRQWGIYANYNNTPNKDLPGFNNESPFPPEIFAPNRAMRERLNLARDKSIAVLSAEKISNEEDFTKWQGQMKTFLTENPTGWKALTPDKVLSKKETPFVVGKDNTVLFTGSPKPDDTIEITFYVPVMPMRSIRIEALPDSANKDRVGRRPDGKFTMTPTLSVNGNALPIAYKQADRRHPAKYSNGFQSPLLEDAWQSAPALWEEPSNAASLPHHAVYHLKSSVKSTWEEVLTLTLASADIGKIRISVSPFVDPVPGDPNAHRPQFASALTSGEKENPELKAAYFLSNTPDEKLPAAYKAARQEILATHAGYAHSMVAQTLPEDQILPTHLLNRGDWMSPLDKVEPALPAYFAKHLPAAQKRLTRADLAEWLLADENPLTRRHFTNRIWKQFFGKGFSNILDDIGNQGEWPSHPELIDWLATEFRDSGWDVKHIVRLIVTSETYQQVSAKNPNLAEIDPDNRLLSEQSARRLDAEFIRDNALAISGLLHTSSIGGPSMQPYQPDDYWANLNFPERKYHASAGSDQYRRGVYTHWQRTFIHPMLAAFDAPSREECAADRFLSNSPQQALALLNDPTFVEAAKALASRLDKEQPNGSDADKIKHAYRLALSREPSDKELESSQAFLTKIRKETPKSDPMQQLCRVILNLHETISRY